MTRSIALLLTTFTGMTGLVYEVTWERYLAILVGSHGEATAAILALFLGGLSLGYAGFGAITGRTLEQAPPGERRQRLLRLYGLVEGGIGVYAIVFPWLFAVAQFLSLRIPAGGSAFAEAIVFAADIVLCAIVIVPGSFLMGATIPVLTQALSNDVEDATSVHARIYAFNTLGAVAGALGGGYFLLPWLGLDGSLRAMALINLAVGGAFVWMAPRSGSLPEAAVAAAPAPSSDEPAAVPGLRSYAVIALLAGFAMMTLQTVVIRVSGLSFGSSPYTFSTVVAVFVLGIALGSFAVGALNRVPRGALAINQWAQLAFLFLLYYLLEYFPYYVFLLRGLFTNDALVSFYAYQWSGVQMVLLFVGPAAFFSGATLPLVFHELRERFGDLGSVAGRLYSWNTVGSLLGALLGGYALLFWLDLDGVFAVALMALVVAASIATVKSFEMPKWIVVLAAAPMILALALLPGWRVELLAAGLFRVRSAPPEAYDTVDWVFKNRTAGRKTLFYDDDPVASIFVLETQENGPDGKFPSRSIVNNGKSDGNTHGDYVTMALASILPAALLPHDPERAFVIGFGTGVSAGELGALPSVEEVIVAEISPGVAEAAPFFDEWNLGVSTNPKIEIVRSDAYRALLRAEGRFDVIVSEPSNPWMAGVDMLFTQDFLEAAKSRLTPNGIYLQWYHQYSTSNEAVEMVLRTYAKVFDRVAVWYGLGSDLFLLGINGDEPLASIADLREKLARPEYSKAMKRMNMKSLAALLAHELIPERVLVDGALRGPVHRITHPRLGYEAARAFFFPGTARMPLLDLASREARVRGEGRTYFDHVLDEARGKGGKRAMELRYANYVRELCKYRMPECVATLGKWFRDQPRSTLRHDMTTKLVDTRPMMGTTFRPRDVRRASELYWPRPPRAPKELSASLGLRMNRLYVDAFHHMAPFDPSALLAVWDQCTQPSPEACEAGRQEALQIIEGRGIENRALRISVAPAGTVPMKSNSAAPSQAKQAQDEEAGHDELPAPGEAGP